MWIFIMTRPSIENWYARLRKLNLQKKDKQFNRDINSELDRYAESKIYQKMSHEVTQSTCVQDSDLSSMSDQSEEKDDCEDIMFSSASDLNLKRLPNLARTCDRYGISPRAGAAIASAVLEDYGIITSADKTHVISRCKLRREIEKWRKAI